MSLHVQGQVVGSGKGPGADHTLEGFGARVLPVVTRQLVGTCEAPVAAVPCAPVWLLTCTETKEKKITIHDEYSVS